MTGKLKDPKKPMPGHPLQDSILQTMAGFPFRLSASRQAWTPPTDLFETEEAMVVKVEAAGMAEDDFSVTFAEGRLQITGIRREPSEKMGYHQMEICYGRFVTEVVVDRSIEKDEISATYSNGFLRVVMPKARAKKIEVQGQSSK